MKEVSLTQLAFTAFMTPATNQGNTSGDNFVSALTEAKNNQDNTKASEYNSNNQYDKKENTKSEESKPKDEVNKSDESKPKDEKVEKPDVVEKPKNETTKVEKPKKELSEEDAMEMVASYLQVQPQQLQDVLDKLGMSIEDLLSDTSKLDEAIVEMYSFEDIFMNKDLAKGIMDLKDFIEENDIVLSNLETLVEEVNFDNVKKVVVEDVDLEQSDVSEDSNLVNSDEIIIEDTNDGETLRDSRQNEDTNNFLNQQTTQTNTQTESTTKLNSFELNTNINMASNTLKQNVHHTTQTNTTAQAQRPVMTQIVEKIQIVTLTDGTQITMDLDPQELGKVSLRVVENSGVVKADIVVENEKVKQMIEEQLDTLKQALADKGLIVSEFNVDVRDQGFKEQMNHSKNKSQKRINELLEAYTNEEMLEPEPEIDITQVQHDQNVNVKV